MAVFVCQGGFGIAAWCQMQLMQQASCFLGPSQAYAAAVWPLCQPDLAILLCCKQAMLLAGAGRVGREMGW